MEDRFQDHERGAEQRLLCSRDFLSWVRQQVLHLTMQNMERSLKDQSQMSLLERVLGLVVKVPCQSNIAGLSSTRELVHQGSGQKKSDLFLLVSI